MFDPNAFQIGAYCGLTVAFLSLKDALPLSIKSRRWSRHRPETSPQWNSLVHYTQVSNSTARNGCARHERGASNVSRIKRTFLSPRANELPTRGHDPSRQNILRLTATRSTRSGARTGPDTRPAATLWIDITVVLDILRTRPHLTSFIPAEAPRISETCLSRYLGPIALRSEYSASRLTRSDLRISGWDK